MHRYSHAPWSGLGSLLFILLLGASPAGAQTTAPMPPAVATDIPKPNAPSIPTARPVSAPVADLPQGVSPAQQPAPDLSMRGLPAVTNWGPRDFVVAGDAIRIDGQIVPNDLIVELGTPPRRLAAVYTSNEPVGPMRISTLVSRVPEDFTSPGAQLTVRYGVNGPKLTLANSLRVVPRPRLVDFQIDGSPQIYMHGHPDGVVTRFNARVADYFPDAIVDDWSRPNLSSDCGDGASYGTSTEVLGGNPVRLRSGTTYFPQAAGRRCKLTLRPYGRGQGVYGRQFALEVGSVQLPEYKYHRIERTADLLDAAAPARRRIVAQATGVTGLPCQLRSVGTAGNFATGVLIEDGDLTFQLRNGAVRELCEFSTTGPLRVKKTWMIVKVDWSFSETPLCTAAKWSVREGQQVSFGAGDGFKLWPVRFQATCEPNARDLPRNSHLFKARLNYVELLGPAAESWTDAFE